MSMLIGMGRRLRSFNLITWCSTLLKLGCILLLIKEHELMAVVLGFQVPIVLFPFVIWLYLKEFSVPVGAFQGKSSPWLYVGFHPWYCFGHSSGFRWKTSFSSCSTVESGLRSIGAACIFLCCSRRTATSSSGSAGKSAQGATCRHFLNRKKVLNETPKVVLVVDNPLRDLDGMVMLAWNLAGRG